MSRLISLLILLCLFACSPRLDVTVEAPVDAGEAGPENPGATAEADGLKPQDKDDTRRDTEGEPGEKPSDDETAADEASVEDGADRQPAEGNDDGSNSDGEVNPSNAQADSPGDDNGTGDGEPADNATSGDTDVTTVTAEAECDTNGALRCVASGSAGREVCRDGQWTEQAACEGQQICYGGAAECIQQDEFCKGNTGKMVCVGSALHTCDESARSSAMTDCQHPERCRLGLPSGDCATCLPGQEFMCDGATLLVCDEDGSGFEVRDECPTASLCNADAGLCGDAACAPGQIRCEGQRLQRCNANQTAFSTVMTCPAGSTCDPAGEECDICSPNATRCENGARQTCAADGTEFNSSPCDGATPHCVGQGECGACSTDSHCAAMAGNCQTATCDTTDNTCTVTIKEGAKCARDGGSGVCTDAGACVECNIAEDCASKAGEQECVDHECRRVPTCGDGILDELNPYGESCDDGNTSDGDACSADCKTPTNYGPCVPDGETTGLFPTSTDCGITTSRCASGGCVLLCSTSAPCPRIPSSPTGSPADDRWKPICRVADAETGAGLCDIPCGTGVRPCPSGMVCQDQPFNGMTVRSCAVSPL